MEEGAFFAVVMRRVAEVLDLQLPSVTVKTNILTVELQLGIAPSEPQLLYNEALTGVLRGAWSKPCTGAPVNWMIARRKLPLLGLHFLHPGELSTLNLHLQDQHWRVPYHSTR